jgi:hypothetical protein
MSPSCGDSVSGVPGGVASIEAKDQRRFAVDRRTGLPEERGLTEVGYSAAFWELTSVATRDNSSPAKAMMSVSDRPPFFSSWYVERASTSGAETGSELTFGEEIREGLALGELGFV